MKSLEEIHPYISIHALLAESDAHQNRINKSLPYFYPRSPCGERLPEGVKGKAHHSGFLSTLSLRRATLRKFRWVLLVGNFYPRSPCGERLTPARMLSRLSLISIHALLAESDLFLCCNAAKPRHFYPRSPCGERPVQNTKIDKLNDFYPRSPCGERPLQS